MPVPPVFTVVVVVTVTVAAGLAFKEFVYEPHLAPKVAVWRSNFNLRRSRRNPGAHPIAVGVDKSSREMTTARRSNLELDELTPRGTDDWRSDSSRNQTLRNRLGLNVEVPYLGASSSLDAPNVPLPHVPLIPTHINDGLSTPSTPRSNNVSRPESSLEPASRSLSLSHRSSSLTLRSPSPPPAQLPQEHLTRALLSTPGPTSHVSNVPSLSSHERGDFDILSSSSGPSSPFSDFSFTAMQSPPATMIETGVRVTSPDAAQDMGFVSIPSPDSDSDSDGFEVDFGTASSAHEDDLTSSGVFSWASASAHSFD